VNTPLDVALRPSTDLRPAPEEDELSLAELLSLFGSEDEVATTSPRHSLRASGALLLGWTQNSSRRAARWGAVAGMPDLRGRRSSSSAAEAVQ
jgi:hypothetical protein